LGAARLAPQRQSHPDLPPSIDAPGSSISIDGCGGYPETKSGNTQSFIITDSSSKLRVVIPTKTKDAGSVLSTIQLFAAHSPSPLRALRTDMGLISQPVTAFCVANNIKLITAAPRAHHANGEAERSVDLIKTQVRVLLLQSGLSRAFIDHAQVYAACALNKTPTTSPILVKLQPPIDAFGESPPFNHHYLPLHPFGCLVYGFVGKQTLDSYASRSIPGVYLGHDPLSTGHRVYHADRDSVLTYSQVHVEPNCFPFREQQSAGERPGSELLHDLAWRSVASTHITKVSDFDIANFLMGKQIVLQFNQSLWPMYPSPWLGLCRSIYTPSVGPVIDKICTKLALHYSGLITDLNASDLRLIDAGKHCEVVLPITPLNSDAIVSTKSPVLWFQDPRKSTTRFRDLPSLRELIASTYPTARTLADVAYHSVGLAGHFPVHSAMAPSTAAHKIITS